MRFYSQSHRFYCGIDLHTRTLSLCILDSAGVVRLEETLPPDRDRLGTTLAPFRDGLVVGCECLFAWYWLADWCELPAAPARRAESERGLGPQPFESPAGGTEEHLGREGDLAICRPGRNGGSTRQNGLGPAAVPGPGTRARPRAG